jgi:uncharacterized membrane protein YkvA (DUF1232 family)
MNGQLAKATTRRALGARPQIGYLHAFFRFMADRNASLLGKLGVLLAIAYVAMPLDVIPDIAPIIGWLDDLGVVAATLGYLSRALQPYRFPVMTAQATNVDPQRARAIELQQRASRGLGHVAPVRTGAR